MIDMLGKRFGRLVVEARAPKKPGRQENQWTCRCDCGRSSVVPGYTLRRGTTTSCGCRKREVGAENGRRNATHGQAILKTPTYRAWCAMRKRCTNEKYEGFYRYGGRGITICARWRDFRNFLADMGEKPAGLSLDRVNNDGNYEPGNCRWADNFQQARNRRSVHLVTIGGVTLCISEWAERAGLPSYVVERRVRRGESGPALLDPAASGALRGRRRVAARGEGGSRS